MRKLRSRAEVTWPNGPCAGGLQKPLTMLYWERPDIPHWFHKSGKEEEISVLVNADRWPPLLLRLKWFSYCFMPNSRACSSFSRKALEIIWQCRFRSKKGRSVAAAVAVNSYFFFFSLFTEQFPQRNCLALYTSTVGTRTITAVSHSD